MSDLEGSETSELIGRVVLGRYRIVRALARGGMGMIYLARSEGAADFVKPVVVKRMLSDQADPGAVRMFKREARIMSMLRHPAIVPIMDFGREDLSYLLVMEYVHGFHLGRWASFVQQARPGSDGSPGQLPWQMAVHVCIQVLDALEYAHTLKGPDGQSLNIVHRDVSPSNVLLDIEGRAFLADFGIAKTSAEEETRTTVGTVKGKFSYMAPEILEGLAPAPTSDAYAAAVVLHEVLTGRNEFRTAEPAATIQRVLSYTPRRLDAVRPDVPTALADVLARALLKEPQERFRSAGELARALRRVRGIDAEEANVELRRLLDRDFRDPRFAPMFELPELDLLEQSWRSPGPLAPASSSVAPAKSRSSEPTKAERPFATAAERATDPSPESPTPLPPPPAIPTVATPARGSASWSAVAVLGVALLGLVGVVAWQAQQQGQPQEIVFVEATPAGIRASDAAIALPDAAQEPEPLDAATDSEANQPGAEPVRPRPDRALPELSEAERSRRRIDETFARHVGGIRGCFEGTAAPSSELSLHFTTDAAGAVSSVEITPPEIGSGTAGRCVERIARRIAFGAEVGARTFRIPLRIRTE